MFENHQDSGNGNAERTNARCAIACCDRVLIDVQAALCKQRQQIAKVAVYLEAAAAAQAEAGLEPADHRAWAWEMCEGELHCHRQWRDWPQQDAHSHSSSQLHNSNCTIDVLKGCQNQSETFQK
jgi:hypothetical protein